MPILLGEVESSEGALSDHGSFPRYCCQRRAKAGLAQRMIFTVGDEYGSTGYERFLR